MLTLSLYVDPLGVKVLGFTTRGASEGRFQLMIQLKLIELQSIINHFLFILLCELTQILIVILYFILYTYTVLIYLLSTNTIKATTTSTLNYVLVSIQDYQYIKELSILLAILSLFYLITSAFSQEAKRVISS